ncbi:MAG: lipopolysaccharide assembly protein LapA domain-containing protein [Betaproteobacteria bacterium]|jgi:uncharacterized integral membrane protein|nr:lipopolysaccharide assembly protein LapA domain-containing protein [Betaproteobacteria bacterium]
MTAVRIAVALAAFVFLLLAALSNTEAVTLRFLRVAQFESPLAFVVFVAFAAGVAAGLAAGAWRNARMRRHLFRLRRRLAAAPAPGPHGAAPSDRPEPPRAQPLDAV